MKLVANKPCTLSGKRYFIGEEIPAEAVADPVALEKMGVLTVIRDGIPVETLEECVASVGEVFFKIKIEIVKGDKGFDLDVTEPQLQEMMAVYSAAKETNILRYNSARTVLSTITGVSDFIDFTMDGKRENIHLSSSEYADTGNVTFTLEGAET